MKKQHALSFLLVVTIIFSLILTASASEPAVIQIDSFNEYDYIERIQESSPKELEEVGLSVQEAQVIISEFYNALSERAALSDDELHAYGYSDHQIDLLHSFAAGQTLSSSELRSLGATCNGEIVRTYCIGKSARFSYTFTWQSCPIMTLSDSAAMRWIAYDDNGNTIGVEQSSRSISVEYHFGRSSSPVSGPAFAHYGFPTYQPNLDFNTINMQFPVYRTHMGASAVILDCYARTGTIEVTINVPKGVNQNIHHIFVSGLYGHTLIGLGSPSVSVTPGSIGIGFTGNTSIDSIADRKATIRTDSTVVTYW